jgi:hypothetical protein
LDGLQIGHDCEVLWRLACAREVDESLRRQPYSDQIELLRDAANEIPLRQRSAWLAGEGFEEYRGDLEAWLHKRASTPFDDDTGTYASSAPRLVTVPNRPPRGTRKRIIAEVAARASVPESTVVRLWTDYRKLMRRVSEAD